MFSALLLGAVISSACALFLKAVISSSSVPAATAPMMTPAWQWQWQWQRRRYDAADHPTQLGLILRRWGAA